MGQSVHILPESNDTTLFLRLTGTVTREDYLKYFMEPAKEIADRLGWYNLLVLHDADFSGWAPDAAEVSFKYLVEYCPKARRLAYVNASDSRLLLMKMLEPVMGNAQIRFFELDEMDEAIGWMRG